MAGILLNRNILIADDDERMLRALDKVLTGHGANVTPTKWAGDAVEVLSQRNKDIDLVIMDLQMPLVTGITMVRAIHQTFPDLPVIVLTGFGNAELKSECLRQGAAAFLNKPLDTVQLVTVIETVFASTLTGGGRDRPGRDGGHETRHRSSESAEH